MRVEQLDGGTHSQDEQTTGLTGGVMAKRTVEFDARKKIKVPVEVEFTTRSGKPVDFEAHKSVKKKVHVKFRAKPSGK